MAGRQRVRTSTCRCGWVDRGGPMVPVMVMATRDPDCPRHGDSTAWWLRIQGSARALVMGQAEGTP